MAAVAPRPPPIDADPVDRTAFAALYRAHVDRVWLRLTRMLGPVADREDLLQQVFLQVFRALPTFRGEAGLATFLHRVTTNVAIDHLRALPRLPAPLDPSHFDGVIGEAEPSRHLEQRQHLALLFELLGELTVDKRIAFVLIAIEGLAVRDAAELVGAKPDAVKQRALAARRELEAALSARTGATR